MAKQKKQKFPTRAPFDIRRTLSFPRSLWSWMVAESVRRGVSVAALVREELMKCKNARR